MTSLRSQLFVDQKCRFLAGTGLGTASVFDKNQFLPLIVQLLSKPHLGVRTHLRAQRRKCKGRLGSQRVTRQQSKALQACWERGRVSRCCPGCLLKHYGLVDLSRDPSFTISCVTCVSILPCITLGNFLPPRDDVRIRWVNSCKALEQCLTKEQGLLLLGPYGCGSGNKSWFAGMNRDVVCPSSSSRNALCLNSVLRHPQ